MLVMRFNRVGRKNHAQYRIVVQEKSAAPGGRHTAVVGSHDPHSKQTVLKADEITKWLSQGVQASDSVHNLLVREGVIKAEKRSKKVPPKKAEEAVETDSAEEAPVAEETKAEEAPAEDTKAEEATEEKTEEKK